MGVAALRQDPLAGGFYTVREAARLLQIQNPRRIYGWLSGYANSQSEAIIERDYAPVDDAQELSFWDLIEIRFIEHFRRQGVPLQTLRKTAIKTRQEFKQKHPFALSNVKFLTDRKKIFSQTVKETGDKTTLNILGQQYEMYDVIEGLLAKGIEFNGRTELAKVWRPLEKECPNVIIDPRFAYGHPVISDDYIPTGALFRLWKAEGCDEKRVAKWYNVSGKTVKEAVDFELRLAH